MNQLMVDEDGNIWEVDANGNPERFVGSQGGAPQAGPQPFTVGQRDPNKALRSDLEIQNIQGQIDDRGQSANLERERFLYQKQQDELKQQQEAAKAARPQMTASERADALTGYQSALSVERLVQNLQRQYDAGVGSTKGLAGLMDYLPTAANQQFDTAGNTARGDIARALGFTGGQLNSAVEAQMNVGPYLPMASDKDAVAQDKIKYLANVAKDAKARSIAILGGVPQPDGGILPIEQAQQQQPSPNAFGQPNAVAPNNPMAYGAPNAVNTASPTFGINASLGKADQGPGPQKIVGASQGYTRTVAALSALPNQIPAMIQAGRSRNEIVAHINSVRRGAGMSPVSPVQLRALDAVMVGHKRNPTAPVRSLAQGWSNWAREEVAASGNAPTLWEKARTSKVGAPATAAGIATANAAMGGFLDEAVGAVGGDALMTQAVKDQARYEHPIATFTGDVAGGTMSMVGLNRAVGSMGQLGAKAAQFGGGVIPDIAYGAAYGAGENNDDRAGGAIVGAVGGGVGNVVGRGAAGMFGRGVRGVSDPAVRYLTERGVPLSLGQVLGNTSKAGRMWNKMESLPYVGDMMGARRLDSKEGFNRLAFEDASARYPGSTAPSEIGEEGARQLGSIKNAAYADALEGVRISPDQQFADDLAGLATRGESNPLHAQSYASMMMDDIRPLFRNNDNPSFQHNELTGEGFQAARQTFQGAKKGFDNQPMGYQMQNLIGDTSKAFDDLLARQAPGALPKYNAANDLNRHISVLNKAARAAKNSEDSLISPAQLKTASYNNTVKYGGEAQAAAGNYPFRELIENSENIIPSRIPDSGTAGRGLAATMPFAISAGAGVGGQQGWISPETAALIGSVALLSSKTGAKVAQNTLVKRPEAVQRLGQKILARRRIGGMFGAGFSAPLAISLGVGAE